jgi:hypothetical protein
MAGKIVVSEILSDATSSNTVKIGAGMTLDLNAQGTIVLPASIPAANLTGSLPAISGASLTNLPASGKVLQVVSDSAANSASFSGITSFTATGLDITITPSSTSSKIFVMFNSPLCYQDTSSISFYAYASIYRSGSNLFGAGGCGGAYFHSVGYNDIGYTFNGSVLDAPATTSAITYEIYYRASTSSSITWGLDGVGTITAMEIAG